MNAESCDNEILQILFTFCPLKYLMERQELKDGDGSLIYLGENGMDFVI